MFFATTSCGIDAVRVVARKPLTPLALLSEAAPRVCARASGPPGSCAGSSTRTHTRTETGADRTIAVFAAGEIDQ